MKSEFAALVLTFCVATVVRADCGRGAFAFEPRVSGVAVVTGAGPLPFVADGAGCPSPQAACRTRAYVVAGDRVITAGRSGDYICALFPNAKGDSAGFLPAARLVPTAIDAAPALRAWVGRWKDGDDEIKLTIKGSRLVVDGSACWPSCNPPLSERPGGPNIGELSGSAAPVGNHVVFSTGSGEFDCTAKLALVGNVLVVSDNENCGGHNVRFDGVYRRVPQRKPQ